MTKLLERAITEVNQLPSVEQDAIASLIFAELQDEQAWEEAYANSQEPLAKLVSQVRHDLASGRMKKVKMGFDEL